MKNQLPYNVVAQNNTVKLMYNNQLVFSIGGTSLREALNAGDVDGYWDGIIYNPLKLTMSLVKWADEIGASEEKPIVFDDNIFVIDEL